MAIVTISRQFGAGGRSLAEKVCRRLGYAFYDNELIQMVADQARVSADSVDALEKDSSGVFQRFAGAVVPKSLRDLVLERKGDSIEEEIYVDLLSRIIMEIAEAGNAVIVGRASQYILQDQEDACHILVRADFKDRVAFMQKNYDLTPEQARRAVEQDDRRRANLYRKFGKSDYDRPILYHMVLNTSRLDLDRGCRLVCELVEKTSPRKDRKNTP